MSKKKPKITTEIVYDNDGSIAGMVQMEEKYGVQVPKGQDPGDKVGMLIAMINGFDEFHVYSWSYPGDLSTPEGEWHVNFIVSRDEEGWDALEFLTHAVLVAKTDRAFDVALSPWNSACDDDKFYAHGSLCFELCGRDCNPAHVVGVIVEEYGKLPADEDDSDTIAPVGHVPSAENDVFCLASAFTELGQSIPDAETLIASGMDENTAAFNIVVFDEAFNGFQSIVDRFGCSSDGIEALKGIVTYYTKVIEEADAHTSFCEEKLQNDSEDLDKLP